MLTTFVSRRSLLSGAAATLALPSIMRDARAAPAASGASISESAWQKLGGKITGGVIRPGDKRFIELTRPENLRYYNPPAAAGDSPDPDAPFGVVCPRDASEVAAAILWARETGCPMVPRSGGHSYAGCSTIAGLVIHGGAMRQVRHDRRSELVELGGGVINGNIFDRMQHTNRSIVHGRCPAVGISAFLMGGGIGLAMREHGVGCDLVEAVELVLADGQRVTATASNRWRELFWALRGGGGGNLGYATRWRLRTVPADNVIAFVVNWWAAEKKQDIFRRLVRALEAGPEQIGAQMSIYATAPNDPLPNRISLTGQFAGPLDKFNQILGAELRDADQKIAIELPYWKTQEMFEIGATPNRYQETSLFADQISDALIDEAFRVARSFPGYPSSARLTFFLTGGQVNKAKPDATAFVHRSSQWLINPILENWPAHYDKLDADLKWQRDVLAKFGAILGTASSYQNFPDPGLEHPAEAYWGANLARLAKAKHAVDPDGIFTPPRNQGIPKAA